MTGLELWAFILSAVATFLATVASILQGKTRREIRTFNGSLEKLQTAPKRASDDLVARVETIARSFREIETEWGNMYDKFRATLKRLQMRESRARTREEGEGTPPPSPPTTHADVWRRIRGGS